MRGPAEFFTPVSYFSGYRLSVALCKATGEVGCVEIAVGAFLFTKRNVNINAPTFQHVRIITSEERGRPGLLCRKPLAADILSFSARPLIQASLCGIVIAQGRAFAHSPEEHGDIMSHPSKLAGNRIV